METVKLIKLGRFAIDKGGRRILASYLMDDVMLVV